MISLVAVLDATAFDALDSPDGRGVRQLFRRVLERGGEVRCAAVTLAEVCRGTARTRRVEAAVARDRGGQRIQVVPTDERLAKLVAAILHEAGRGSADLGAAHVVAVSAEADVAVVVTEDADDVAVLSEALPGTRITTRTPRSLLLA
jgi:predicted nucleic acid-binding protein